MKEENGVKTKIDIVTLGLKLDNIDKKISQYILEQQKLNNEMGKRIFNLEKTFERWKGYWAGGMALITIIYALITFLSKFV